MNNNKNRALALEITAYLRSERKKNLGDSYVDIPVEEDVEDTLQVLDAEIGLNSVADFEAYSLWEAYYELHKDAYGVKARWSRWYDHDADGWRKKIASIPIVDGSSR
jgi:hypothetical protein